MVGEGYFYMLAVELWIVTVWPVRPSTQEALPQALVLSGDHTSYLDFTSVALSSVFVTGIWGIYFFLFDLLSLCSVLSSISTLSRNLPAMQETWIPGLGRSSGEGKGYPLLYSALQNSIVHGGHKELDRTERLSISLSTLSCVRDSFP